MANPTATLDDSGAQYPPQRIECIKRATKPSGAGERERQARAYVRAKKKKKRKKKEISQRERTKAAEGTEADRRSARPTRGGSSEAPTGSHDLHGAASAKEGEEKQAVCAESQTRCGRHSAVTSRECE